MDITIHSNFLPQDDPDAALNFYRDTLGFEVRNDVGYDGMRWITVGPPGQPGTAPAWELNRNLHIIGGALEAGELDAKRAIRQGAELAAVI